MSVGADKTLGGGVAINRYDGAGGTNSSIGWWPGLDGPTSKNEMDPTAVRHLADELEALWRDLTDNTSGTLEDVMEKSNAVTASDAFGKWDTAREMTETYVAGYREIELCYGHLRDQLAQAVATLRYEADLIEGVDADIADSLRPGQPGATRPDIAATPGMPR